jgi:hypothetical protein
MAPPWDDTRTDLKASRPVSSVPPKLKTRPKRKKGYDRQGWTPRRAIGLDPREGPPESP